MINIENVNIQKLKLEDLIADAVERKDETAIAWLRTEAMKTIERKGKDGTTKQGYQPVNMYRVEYLTKFCGYQKRNAAKLTAEQKREKKLNAMFEEAAANIK